MLNLFSFHLLQWLLTLLPKFSAETMFKRQINMHPFFHSIKERKHSHFVSTVHIRQELCKNVCRTDWTILEGKSQPQLQAVSFVLFSKWQNWIMFASKSSKFLMGLLCNLRTWTGLQDSVVNINLALTHRYSLAVWHHAKRSLPKPCCSWGKAAGRKKNTEFKFLCQRKQEKRKQSMNS